MHKYIIPALIIFFLAQLYFISTPIISNEDLLKNDIEDPRYECISGSQIQYLEILNF